MTRVTHRKIGASAGFDPAGEGGRPVVSRNIYRDYSAAGEPSWRTAPGFRLHTSLSEKINGIFPFGEGVLHETETAGQLWLVHAGNSLYLVRADDGSKRKFLGLTLSNHESRGCFFDGWFYLLDGTNFVRVRVVPQAGSDSVFYGENVGGYVPTCFLNGEPYEPANVLSGVYRIAADLSDPGGSFDTGFRYGRTGRQGEAVLLSASAAAGDVYLPETGDVYLPETVSVDGETLRLTEIGAHAFDGNLTVTGVVCPDGVARIGASAFRGCTALVKFSGGEELTRIGLSAFRGCSALTTVLFPGTLRWIQSYAFYGCSGLSNLHYGGDDFSTEVGVSILGNSPIFQLTPINGSDGAAEFGDAYTLTFDAPADEVEGVTLDGASIWDDRGDPIYSVGMQNGKAVSVTVTTTDRRKLCGKRLEATVSAPSRRAGSETVREAFPRYSGEIPAMIRRCRLLTVFDGRLFLSGNPDVPDAVFYSCRSAAGAMEGGYYGVYQYFRDGEGRDSVVSLVAGPDALTVFTSGEGRGGVFRHTAASTGDDQLPRIYPREGGNRLPGEVGDAILYRDAPVFVSSSGIYSVLPTGLRYERSVVCRSEGIASLFPSDCSSVRLAVWDGYLAVFLPGGEVLLGDGRQRKEQPSEGAGFEWWRLSGVGGRNGDHTVYRFSSALSSAAAALGITLAPPEMRDTEAEGTVVDEEGTLSVTVGTDRYAVYGGREKAGGTRESRRDAFAARFGRRPRGGTVFRNRNGESVPLQYRQTRRSPHGGTARNDGGRNRPLPGDASRRDRARMVRFRGASDRRHARNRVGRRRIGYLPEKHRFGVGVSRSRSLAPFGFFAYGQGGRKNAGANLRDRRERRRFLGDRFCRLFVCALRRGDGGLPGEVPSVASETLPDPERGVRLSDLGARDPLPRGRGGKSQGILKRKKRKECSPPGAGSGRICQSHN